MTTAPSQITQIPENPNQISILASTSKITGKNQYHSRKNQPRIKKHSQKKKFNIKDINNPKKESNNCKMQVTQEQLAKLVRNSFVSRRNGGGLSQSANTLYENRIINGHVSLQDLSNQINYRALVNNSNSIFLPGENINNNMPILNNNNQIIQNPFINPYHVTNNNMPLLHNNNPQPIPTSVINPLYQQMQQYSNTNMPSLPHNNQHPPFTSGYGRNNLFQNCTFASGSNNTTARDMTTSGDTNTARDTITSRDHGGDNIHDGDYINDERGSRNNSNNRNNRQRFYRH